MRYLFLTLLLLTAWSANATNKTDSLNHAFEIAQTDTAKISILLELATDAYLSGSDQTESLIDSAYTWAKQENDFLRQTKALNLSGLYLWQQHKLDEALDTFLKSLELSNQINENRLIATASANAAILYGRFGKPDTAITLFNNAIDLFTLLKDSAKIYKTTMDLGGCYANQGKFKESLEYHYECLKYFENKQDTQRLIFVYGNLAVTNQQLGNYEQAIPLYKKAIDYDLVCDKVDILSNNYLNVALMYTEMNAAVDSAYHYFDKAKEILDNSNNKYQEVVYNVNLGNFYFDQGRYPEALSVFNEAYQSPVLDHMLTYDAIVNLDLGMTHVALGELKTARKFMLSGLEKSIEAGSIEHIQKSYYNLYGLDSIEGNYEGALQYYQKSKEYSDTLMLREGRQRLAELEAEYHAEKNELENTILKEESKYNQIVILKQRYIVGLTLLALIITVILFIVVKRGSKKLKIVNSHLEQQKEELETLNLTKDKFFSIIAHDLKSPFTSLLGLIEILETDHGAMTAEEQYSIIEDLGDTAKNTYNLLSNLLDWARSQRGKIEYQSQEVDIVEQTSSILTILKNRIEAKQISVDTDMDDVGIISTDPQLFQAIILNLMNNAIKFTPELGFISLSIKNTGTHIKLCISDSGIGIPESEIERLFQIDNKFQRSGTNGEPGTGLGLILCHEYIQLMSGTIKVESKSGNGCKFCIELPN